MTESHADQGSSSIALSNVVLLISLLAVLVAVLGIGFVAALSRQGPEALRTLPTNPADFDQLQLSKDFVRVDNMWGCSESEDLRCFLTSLPGQAAAAKLVTALNADYEKTAATRGGTGYAVCGSLGESVVIGAVMPHISNARLRDDYFVLPNRLEPKYDGNAVFVGLSDLPCQPN